METPLELLKKRLSYLEILANQRGFYRTKKDAAKIIPLYRKAIQLIEAELNQAEVIGTLPIADVENSDDCNNLP